MKRLTRKVNTGIAISLISYAPDSSVEVFPEVVVRTQYPYKTRWQVTHVVHGAGITGDELAVEERGSVRCRDLQSAQNTCHEIKARSSLIPNLYNNVTISPIKYSSAR